MKLVFVLLGAVGVLSMMGATVTSAATTATSTHPSPAVNRQAPGSFEVEGKVLATHRGWINLSVSRVMKGNLKANTRVRVNETPTTAILEYGKPAKASAIQAGERVRVTGDVKMSGKRRTYNAMTITIEQ